MSQEDLDLSISVISRYLIRETTVSFLAVVSILLVVIVGGSFVRLLGQVADGSFSASVLLPMLGLSTVGSLSILMSVSLFLAVMVTLGRLYADSEITALRASGMSGLDLLKPFLMLGFLIALLQASLSLWLEPWSDQVYQNLKAEASQTADLGGIPPGRFVTLEKSKQVAYAEHLDTEQGVLKNLYLFSDEGEQTQVIAAVEAGQMTDPDSGKKYLQLRTGDWFTNDRGSLASRLIHFEALGLFLPGLENVKGRVKPKTMPTAVLASSHDLRLQAELQWRIASPVMVLVLVILAVPLSHTSPRKGRFATLGIAVVGCIFYFNFLALAKDWMASGVTPRWLGLWWVHFVPLSIAAVLMWRQGSFSRLRAWLRKRRA